LLALGGSLLPVDGATQPVITIYGSSVAEGAVSLPTTMTNGSLINGYAGRMTTLLESQGWAVTNVSVPGYNTSAANLRFDFFVVPTNPDYVLLGLSLGNEGLVGASNPDGVFESFRSGMTNLIGRCRDQGYVPVVGLCYPHGNYSLGEYEYLKRMNLLMNTWDVPSLNFLGALDDGSGRWAAGYTADPAHPNTAGHEEMFYTFVPSLFDALAAGRTNRPSLEGVTRYLRLRAQSAASSPITYTPSNPLHSFTTAFRVRSTGTGTVAAVRTGTNWATVELRSSGFVYRNTNALEIASVTNSPPGGWHDVVLTHHYARGETLLFVDGLEAGRLAERFAPDQFVLGGPGGAVGRPASPAVADFRNWCVYRAGWNPDEALAQHLGSLQQASMEVCAPLDDPTLVVGSAAANRAQSLAEVIPNSTNTTSMALLAPPDTLAGQALTNGLALLSWNDNSTNETGFAVDRRVAGSGAAWSEVAVLPPGSSSYTNSGLAAGVTYEFRVAAREGVLRSDYAGPVSVITGVAPLPAVRIDFGPDDGTNGDATSSPDFQGQHWNNMIGVGGGALIPGGGGLGGLLQTNGVATAFGLVLSNGFAANGKLNGGLLAPSESLLGTFAVTNATQDYFFTTSQAGFRLTNLAANAFYNLRFFGTRQTTISRISRYRVSGGNGVFTQDLATSGAGIGTGGYNGNNDTLAEIVGVIPDGNNEIQVGVSVVAGGFAYLGIMELISSTPPGFNELTASVVSATGDAVLTYVGIPHYQYALETTANLAPPVAWSAVATNLAGPDGLITFTHGISAPVTLFRTREIGVP
jgi:hypothetical protein